MTLLQSPRSPQLSNPKFHTPLLVVKAEGLALALVMAWVMATSPMQHAPVELSAELSGCRSVPAKSLQWPQLLSCDLGRSWHNWQLQWNKVGQKRRPRLQLSHYTLWRAMTLMLNSGKHVDTVDTVKHGCFLKPGSQEVSEFAWQINAGMMWSSTRMWEFLRTQTSRKSSTWQNKKNRKFTHPLDFTWGTRTFTSGTRTKDQTNNPFSH